MDLWEVFEHLRIAQEDIVEFSRNADHQSPAFPKGYWPTGAAPKDTDAWEQSVVSFRRDLAAMKAIVLDPEIDLHAKIPHGDGQNNSSRSDAHRGPQRLPPGPNGSHDEDARALVELKAIELLFFRTTPLTRSGS